MSSIEDEIPYFYLTSFLEPPYNLINFNFLISFLFSMIEALDELWDPSELSSAVFRI